MVTIPREKFTGATTTGESPAAKLDPSVMAEKGMMLAELAHGIGSIAEELGKAESEMQLTKHTNNFSEKALAIKSAAEQDPDASVGNRNKYYDQLRTALEEESQGISLPSYKNQFLIEQGKNAEITRTEIDLNFYRKKMADDKKEWERFKIINGEKYKSGLKETAIQELDTRAAERVKNHLITPEQAELEKSGTKAKWLVGKLKHDVWADPDGVISQASLGKKGEFADVDPEILEREVSRANNLKMRRLAETKMQQKIVWGKNEHEMYMNKYLPGTLTEPEIEAALLNNKISGSFGEKMLKNLGSPTSIHGVTDDKTYMDMINFMMDEKNTTEDIRKKMLDYNTAGKLSKIDMEKLYMMHIVPIKGDKKSMNDIVGAEEATRDMSKARWDAIAAAKNNFEKFYLSHGGIGLNKVATMMKKLVNKTQDEVPNKDIPALANQILYEQRVNDLPDIANFPPDGGYLQDDDGNRSKFLPDGSPVEEDQIEESIDAGF